MASLDVVTLYDNVNVEFFLNTILPNLLEKYQCIWRKSVPIFSNVTIPEMIQLFRVVLNSAFFAFEGVAYRQRFGLPMGSPVSVAVAELYMDYVEKEHLETADTEIYPLFYT